MQHCSQQQYGQGPLGCQSLLKAEVLAVLLIRKVQREDLLGILITCIRSLLADAADVGLHKLSVPMIWSWA